MLTLRTFGALDLRDADGAPLSSVLVQSKRSALLAYLAVARPGQLHRRDSLLALFWPDLDQPRGRSALSQALSFLRREVGEGVVVTQGPEEVGVDPARLRCDVVEFLQAVEEERWAEALALYRGEFLEGLHVEGAPEFADWVDRERKRLRESAAAAAWTLAHERVAGGGLVEAERTAQRALELVATDESPVRAFIEALAGAGERGAALGFYEKFKGALARELGVEPAPETSAVAEAVRRGEIGAEEAPRRGASSGKEEGEAPARETREAEPGPSIASPPTTDSGLRPPGGEQSGAAPLANAPAGRIARQPWERVVLGGVALAVLAAGGVALGRWLGPDREDRRESSSPPPTAIAVLPFQNLSGQGPHAYFAGGLHDELLTQLSKVAALTVMGRTSVMAYEGTAKPLRDIAGELGVGSVLEGSVQVLGERLRVNVQLLDAATGQHLWAERYDGILEDAFAIQSDIAQRIVAAVGATLTGTEARAMAAAPTGNAEAYHLYLQGRQYFIRGLGDPTIVVAAELCDSAVALDPEFALAYSLAAKAHARTYFQGIDQSRERAARAKTAATRALELDSGLPEAHEALGWYRYWVERDLSESVRHFSTALSQGGGNPDVQLGLGLALRRLGRWDEAQELLHRASELDPLSAEAAVEIGISHLFARRYPDAVDAFRRATTLAPDQDRGYGYLAAALVAQGSGLDAAIQVLLSGAEAVGEARFVNGLLGPNACLDVRWLLPELPSVAEGLLPRAELGNSLMSYYVMLAEWHLGHGRVERQRAYGDSALLISPTDALALAHVGKREAALRAARDTLDARASDRRAGPQDRQRIARLYSQLGEVHLALEELERWLASPREGSVEMVRYDPAWDPLRDDPRFQALLIKYADPQPVR